MSVSTDVERGLIGVGGSPYSLLLPRSKDFSALGTVLQLRYAITKKSGNIFRVGVFLDFVWLTTRTPHGAYVRRARRNRIYRHGGEIERLRYPDPLALSTIMLRP